MTARELENRAEELDAAADQAWEMAARLESAPEFADHAAAYERRAAQLERMAADAWRAADECQGVTA